MEQCLSIFSVTKLDETTGNVCRRNTHLVYLGTQTLAWLVSPNVGPVFLLEASRLFQALEEHSMDRDCRKASPTLGDTFINSVFFPVRLCSDHNVENGEACFCVSFTKGHMIKRLAEVHDPDETEIHF